MQDNALANPLGDFSRASVRRRKITKRLKERDLQKAPTFRSSYICLHRKGFFIISKVREVRWRYMNVVSETDVKDPVIHREVSKLSYSCMCVDSFGGA
jgi:hypothetical protein